MLRPEPRPPPSPSSETTTTGRWWRSTSREATIPTTPGCQPSPARTSARRLAQLVGQLAPRRLGGGVDLALGRPPLGVGPAQLGRDLLGPRLVLGQQQLDPGVGPVQPPGRVDPRRQPEREIALVQPRRLAFRGRHQRPQPGPPARRISASPRLTNDRFSPTSGTTSATVASATRSRSARLGCVLVPPERARQLPGHRGAAERRERVAAQLRDAGSGSRAAPRRPGGGR